jgi:hypothetical protein
MGLSNRQKAIRLAELEKERRWQEHRRLHPAPPPPPWTEGQLAELDQMRSILDKLTFQQGHDIDLVSELFRFGFYFEGNSLKLRQLGREITRYRKLEQYAAKARHWETIQRLLYDLQGELSVLRRSGERCGASDQ